MDLYVLIPSKTSEITVVLGIVELGTVSDGLLCENLDYLVAQMSRIH